MKILFVNWQDRKNPLSGGAEVHLHEVCKYLVNEGIQCTLLCHRFLGSTPEEVLDGIKVIRRGKNRNLFNFTVWFSISKIIKQENPDVVVDDSNKIPFFLSWICKKPVVARIHHLFDKTIYSEVNALQATYVYVMESLAVISWKNIPVITVSNSTKDELFQKGVKDISICHNGVDLEVFKPAPVKKDPFHLVYLGRIKKYKKLDILLYVVYHLKKKFPEIKLSIAGGGDDVARLKNSCKQLNIEDRVSFLGFIPVEEKVELYSKATLLLNPSLKEGWGLTNIEANACGTIVVAHDVPGLKDSIKAGETGYLIPYRNQKGFDEAVEKLFSRPDIRKKMEQNALKWAQEFTWKKCAEDTLKVLKKAISK